jgi:hypothetical protein
MLLGLSMYSYAQISKTGVLRNTNAMSTPAISTVQGKIIIDASSQQQLQQLLQKPLAQIAGNQVQVQVWQVNYTADKNSTGVTDIIFQQKVNAAVAYNAVQDGIEYKADGVPAGNNFVVVVLSPALPAQPLLVISGHPNDGHSNTIHGYLSDAKAKLTNFKGPAKASVLVGIYSLTPNQTDLQQVNFAFVNKATPPNCKTCDVFSDVGKVAGDIVDGAGQVIKTVVDGAVNTVKDIGEAIVINGGIFSVQCFGMVATFLQTGQLPKVKSMSEYGNAYDIANNTIFMGSLPPKDMIYVTNLVTVSKRQFTLPVEGLNGRKIILMNMGEDGFNDPLGFKRNDFPGDVFIHELTHAWQIWHIDNLRLFEQGAVNQFKNTVMSDQYKYDCTGHNLTDPYNTEQQAMIVQYFYDLLFWAPNTNLKGKTSGPCGFEQQWVVQNILANRPGMNELYTATAEIIKATANNATNSYTGGITHNTLAFFSNGNRNDGGGYFLPGKQNNSFYYYSSKTNAVTENGGAIRDRYTKEGAEHGNLGWPEIDQVALEGGAFQRFNHGHIYWTPKYGAYVVRGNIFDTWAKQNWEKGPLGFPISDFISSAPGTANTMVQASVFRGSGYQKFEHGEIRYSGMEGAAPEVVMNNTIMKTRAETPMPTQQATQPAASSSTVKKVSPMDKQAINPQPLPPKVRTGASVIKH